MIRKMVNLTKAEREQKVRTTANHLLYALRFLREKILNATVNEQNMGVTFRFTEFASYMIDNSPEFVSHRESLRNTYGQPFPKSYYLNSKRSYIQTLINELVVKSYISMVGYTPSLKNKSTNTMLYRINTWDVKAK